MGIAILSVYLLRKSGKQAPYQAMRLFQVVDLEGEREWLIAL